MSYNLVQTKRFQQVGDVTTWSVTFDNPTTSGNLITIGVQAFDSSFDVMTGFTIDDAGTNTISSVIQSNHAGGSSFARGGMFYIPNCVGKATHLFNITPTASGTYSGAGDVQVHEWSNIIASPLDGTPQSLTGSTSPASTPAITASASGLHLAIGSFKDFANLSITPGGGWTQIIHPLGFYGTHSMYRTAVNGVSQAPSWTLSESMDDGWAGLHAVFSDAVVTVFVPIDMIS